MKLLAASLILLAALIGGIQTDRSSRPAGSATEAMYRAAAESANRKFRYLEQNAARKQPDQQPTQFTEREINAYFAAGYVKLPKGVRRVQFSGSQGVVTGTARVDFDQLTEGKRAANPLLALFTGVHDVEVTAHASGSGHQGRVHVGSVSIGGITVPRVALQYFMDQYITPKYPNVGMDSTFTMPARVDIAIIRDHLLTVTQK